MANILLRSPYYESATKAGATTAQMRLYVGGSLKYTTSKSTNSAGLALFEIAELSRDYLDIEFYGSYLPQTIAISGDIIHFNEDGEQILLPYQFTHRGFDGFGYFEEGRRHIFSTRYRFDLEIRSDRAAGCKFRVPIAPYIQCLTKQPIPQRQPFHEVLPRQRARNRFGLNRGRELKETRIICPTVDLRIKTK